MKPRASFLRNTKSDKSLARLTKDKREGPNKQK